MNEYDDLIAQTKQTETAQAARLGFSIASESDPDIYAEAQRVARRTGVPVDTVLNMQKEMKQQDRMGLIDFDAMAKTSPATAAIMADVERAKIAHDDVETLTGIETAFQFMKDSGSAMRSGIYSMNAGIVGIAQAPVDLVAPFVDPLAGRLLPENPLRRVSAGLAEYRQGIDATAKGYMPRGDGNIEQGWYSGLASLSRNLTTLPIAFLPGGQPIALGAMVAPVFGEEFGKARDKGLGPVNAATYGASQAAIEYATEKIPLSRLVGDVKAGEAFFKMLGRQAAAEVPGEQVATILQDLNEWAVINPEKPFSAYLAERPDAAVQTLVATLVGVGGQTTVVKGIDSAIALVEGRKQRAEMSDQGSKFLEGLNKLAAADKLLARDPETFEQFVAQAAEGGPVQQVFIDGKTLMQSGVAEQLAAVSPAIAEQLETAVATGGQIAIPVEEYTARIAPTEYAQSLMDHLKTEPDGFSRAEAQEYMQSGAAQELEAEAQRILGEQQVNDTFKASQQIVKDAILQNLNTVGRNTAPVNEAYATLTSSYVAVRAAQLGVTPEAFFAKHLQRVVGESVAGGQQFDQINAPFAAENLAEFDSFKTGQAVTFDFIHNTESATKLFGKPKKGDRYQRDLEPSGRYIQAGKAWDGMPKNMTSGTITFNNPLVVKGDNWKKVLSDHYGKTGKRLSLALIADGYDGVVTIDKYGPSETLDLTTFDEAKALYQSPAFDGPETGNTPIGDLTEIEVDGVMRPATNSNGVAIHPTAEGVRNFWRWFADSRVVDDQGRPLVMYHGTSVDSDFSKFKVGKRGAWFTSNQEVASEYAEQNDSQKDQYNPDTRRYEKVNYAGRVMPVYLKVENPYKLTNEDRMKVNVGNYAKAQRELFATIGNHDGILWNDALTKEWVVLDAPTQIKSATGNQGTFDGSNPNILMQGPRGSFNPETNLIALLAGADLSTYLHESAHYFFETDIAIAGELAQEARAFGIDSLSEGERQILDDVSKLMTWHGVQGDIDNQLAQWAGMDFEEKRAYHERTAESFEHYLFEGKAPSIELQPYFQKFRAWMTSVYRSIKDFLARNPEAGKLNPEVSAVFDRMLATNEQIALAEQGRSMMPLFATAEQAGMTPEEFAAYQGLGVDASNEAIQDLQARGLRDMQWLHNARGRIIKRLQRESKDQRAAVEMDVRREVMSQPIYRAWQFLTAKQSRDDLVDSEKARADYREAMTAWNAARKEAETEARKGAKQEAWAASEEGRKKYRKDGSLVKAQQKVLKREEKAIEADVQKALAEWEVKNRKPVDPDVAPKSSPDVLDETRDSLFVAIAKLGGINKAETVGAWGVDPADRPQSGVFGKPVWRIDGGLSIDGMAEALSQYGYLTLDENGKWDIRELEDKFRAELSGDAQLSTAYDYAADQQQADAITNPAGLTAGRFDLPALLDMGLPVEVVNAIKARKMTAKAGLHPDQAAELFGFTSGDELVRALAAAETPKDAINALTDVRMLEQYGDLSSPGAVEKAADKAIHNEARARMIATEANALAKATGQRKVLADAAKEFAAAMIARLKVRNIKPGQYANAEVRAGKAAEKAIQQGDTALAAAEKRNQLINTYATRAAHDAQEDVDAGLRYLKRFEGKVKGLDADYIDQIDTLLERFDLRKGQSLKAIDKRKSFSAWLEAQRESGMEPDVPESLENDAYRKSYKDMTVEEFRGLIDTIKQIEHLGRLKKRLLTARDERELAAIVAEAEASIRENGGKERPVELETPRGFKPWLEGIAAGHRKLSSLLRQMDGGKDNGPMWRVLGRGMNDAGTAEAVMIEDATKRLAEIFKPILAMKGGTTGGKQFIPAINASLTRGGRLAVALNWGNETNRQRIMDGDQWSPAQANAVLSTLTREEWAFVQNAWDFIDSYWPNIAAKEKRVTGRAPEKVQAAPFTVTLADGSVVNLRGGYYPIKYDSNRDDKAEKHDAASVAQDMLRGAMTRATTRRGHTKERVENVKRPVKKTLDVITQHVSEVAHDLAWHEWLIDANRLIDEPKINQAIRDHYGTEVIRTIKDTLQGIATADIVPQTKMDQALLYLRANVSRATMGMSLTTAFLQPFGLTQSMVRIGPKHVLRGIARWGGDIARFQNAMTWIGEKSDFMRLRNKTFNRELHEIKGRVVQGRSQARQIYDASLFMLMQKMQMVADIPTWIGAYEKALAENHDDATAVAMADQSVLDSQGGGQTKDMSELQRKHPMLTMFYSYFSVTLNLAAESTAKTDFKNPLAVAGWLSDMALLMIIPALGPALILHLLKGGDDDDDLETWLKRMAEWQAGYLLGTVIGARELSGTVAGFDYTGPPAGRIITELSRLSKQAQQGELDEGLAMSAVQVMGAAVGIPSVQIVRSWRGWNAWAEDDAPATSILLGPPTKD